MRNLTGLISTFALVGVILLGMVGGGTLTALQNPPTATPATPTITRTPVTLATAQPTARAESVLLSQTFPLAALGVRNVELTTPQGTARFSFRVPDNWLTNGQNVLNLALEFNVVSLLPTTPEPGTTLTARPDATLRVRLDGVLVSTIRLPVNEPGRRLVSINLPAEIMANPTNRFHNVQLDLEGRDQCLQSLESVVRVNAADSTLRFEYQLIPPALDLAQFPRPFYNTPIGGQVESVLLVLPEAYTDQDLQAAAAVAAGLGQLSRNNLALRATTADALTDADRAAALILIGQLGKHSLIDAYYSENRWPTRIEGGRLIVGRTQIDTDNGVLQIIANPRNPQTAILAVTGQSAEAVAKAVQVLTGSPSLLGLGGSVALVSQVRLGEIRQVGADLGERITLADLGIINVPIYGVGTQFGEISFPLPSGIELTEDASLDLVFDYSDALAQLNASLTVYMNDTPLNAAFIRQETNSAARTGRIQARIPPTSVRIGELNTIVLQVNSTDISSLCDSPSSSVVWLMPRPESTINLPRRPATPLTRIPLLNFFPIPFNRSGTLEDVWFVLADQPTADDLTQFVRVAGRLGASIPYGLRFAPKVSRGQLPAAAKEFHLILMGRPTTSSAIRAVNDALPQPFQPGSDALDQVLDDVVYRLPPGLDIGVIQLLEQPGTTGRAMLVLTGTGPAGLSFAVDALIGPAVANFIGNVVYAGPGLLWTINTRTRETVNSGPTPTRAPTLPPSDSGGSTGTGGTSGTGATGTAQPPAVVVVTVTPTPTLTPTATPARW